MVSLINKQLLLTAYAYLFILEQQKAQEGSEALQLQSETSQQPATRLCEWCTVTTSAANASCHVCGLSAAAAKDEAAEAQQQEQKLKQQAQQQQSEGSEARKREFGQVEEKKSAAGNQKNAQQHNVRPNTQQQQATRDALEEQVKDLSTKAQICAICQDHGGNDYASSYVNCCEGKHLWHKDCARKARCSKDECPLSRKSPWVFTPVPNLPANLQELHDKQKQLDTLERELCASALAAKKQELGKPGENKNQQLAKEIAKLEAQLCQREARADFQRIKKQLEALDVNDKIIPDEKSKQREARIAELRELLKAAKDCGDEELLKQIAEPVRIAAEKNDLRGLIAKKTAALAKKTAALAKLDAKLKVAAATNNSTQAADEAYRLEEDIFFQGRDLNDLKERLAFLEKNY